LNLREGTRRLALLLGVSGAIICGVASYLELQDIQSQRACYNRFEQLAASDVVKQERNNLITGEKQKHTFTDCDIYPVGTVPYTKFDCYTSVLYNGGIKAIAWNTDYAIYSIQTEDGQTFYPTQVPSLWKYLLVALFPVLGFFVPWGVIRAIGWVVAGFARP
jgi:hypothetical protein